MSEEEQEKLYKLLFKDTKNKLEAIIKKLRKENKKLKKKNKEYEKIINEALKQYENDLDTISFLNYNRISKAKIREKIKEYQNKLLQDIEENKVVEYENIIQVLEELLEE